MVKNQPTVISTFSGCGGSSLGYKWAGYKELLAIDFDQNSVETFRLNFPDVPCWQRDIREVSGKEILKFCKIEKRELDLLDGSPPCQGFSISGKREVNDERNNLFLEFVRLIKELEPKVFLMENVPGMIKGKMKGRFIEIMKTLKKLPYKVKCKKMNTAYYSVPQNRERLIWIGVRNDLNKEPSYPLPDKKIITAREALDGLLEDTSATLTGRALELWLQSKPGKDFSNYHEKGSWFNHRKINPDKPCPIIITSLALYHWEYPRRLNISELKQLASFPDNFQFIGSFGQQWARIGNAVMPKFMEAIALHIRKNILEM